jgi:RHS repeat-associated protein
MEQHNTEGFWEEADDDVQVTPNGGSAVDAEVRGRFFIARNVPLQSKADNSIVASTSATTLADHSPSSDTVLDVSLDQNIMWSYTYNSNGDLALKYDTIHNTQVLWSYTYRVDGWLEKVVKQENGQTVFTEQCYYDPIGRKYKVSTTENQQTTTRYFVHDRGSIILELDEDEELSREFVRGLSLGGGIGGLLYVRDSSGQVGYFHYDGRGNVVSVTDASRTEVAYYEYDAWGNILTACGDLANEFKFSTKQASTGTGLIDFGCRWYDRSTGRWTQRDPLGATAGTNRYSYLAVCPISALDPWGANVTWDSPQNQPAAADRGKEMWANLRRVIEDAAKKTCEGKFLKKLIDFLDSPDVEWTVRVQWYADGSTTGWTTKDDDDSAYSRINLGREGNKGADPYFTMIHEAWHAAQNLGFDNIEWCMCLDQQCLNAFDRMKNQEHAIGGNAQREFGAVYVTNMLRAIVGYPANWLYRIGKQYFDFSPYAERVTCTAEGTLVKNKAQEE